MYLVRQIYAKEGMEQHQKNFFTLLHANSTIQIEFSKKIVAKLNNFDPLYESKWDILMELCLKEYQRKQSPWELTTVNQQTGLQE